VSKKDGVKGGKKVHYVQLLFLHEGRVGVREERRRHLAAG